ncbi:conserved membrane hypothetical protein [Candidatus Zixiibacteriota bacterium]|nr:conserved membrane hypothetical protein [candidate division Zixibacteria bacterium]
MFIGHLGVGLALKRAEPRINVGWYLIAAEFLDILLFILIMSGLEQVHVSSPESSQKYMTFVFPYSHSLIGSIFWSTLFGFLAAMIFHKWGKAKIALLFVAGVFSHFVLDFLVHPPELPLWGNSSPKIGLGLWNEIYFALLLELLILIFALVMYYRATMARNRLGKYGLGVLMGLITVLAFAGQLSGPPPGNAFQVALSSEFTIVVLIALAYWLDGKRSSAASA